MTRLSFVAVVAAVFTTASAHATVIDFSDQPTGPCCFGSVAGPKTITENLAGVTVTFSGGVILTNESAQSTDDANVYATASPFVLGGTSTGAAAGFTNPLVVTFSHPLQNFQIDISNALAGNYELLDNLGNTDFFNLATTGGSAQTVGFAATGITVDILYLSGSSQNVATQWDFAIGDVTFNLAPATTVPEPATWTMLILGMAMVGFAARRRKPAPARIPRAVVIGLQGLAVRAPAGPAGSKG